MAMKWYVVHTYSNFENQAKKSLEERIRLESLQELFGEILIPMEQVVEMVKGEKKTSRRKFFPGYIFQALSFFNWVCWIAPNNVVINQLFGYSSGLVSLISPSC